MKKCKYEETNNYEKSKSEKMNTICEFFLIMGVRFLIDENILMQ